jgi:hypothetical protein
MEKNIFNNFTREEVMEGIEINKALFDKKWREKIEYHLLHDYELEVDEFIKNFKSCGGDKGSRLKYWNIATKKYEIPPPHKNYCICDHYIQENCYVVDRRDKDKEKRKIVVLGNCCIKRFLPPDSQGRTCERCEKPHRNSKDNFCKECRKRNKEEEKLKSIEDEKLREIEYRERQKQRVIEYRERFRERQKENERVWTNEEIQEILIKIWENSKIRCCAEKYEDEEKINDDFKICGYNGCEKLHKISYKYCYSCYAKIKKN